MKIDDFDYCLPQELIAQEPLLKRDECNLMVLHRDGVIEHRKFHEIINYLNPPDVLVINITRVIPARLHGVKEKTGGKAEIFLLKRINKEKWECILKPSRRLKEGTVVIFPGISLRAEIIERGEKNTGIVRFTGFSIEKDLFKIGQVPLPPYIKRKNGPNSRDEREYQTVYAQEPGAVAAPTAGLHFTTELLETISKKGVQIVQIVLHTGWASFFSLPHREVEKNRLPAEYFKVPVSTAEKINSARKKGGKIVAVGTTTVRTLETASSADGVLPGEGWTELFIYPGYKFKTVDALITNFHMPRSPLLLLVAAFVGKDLLMQAYREAVRLRYRFLSYGDAMFII